MSAVQQQKGDEKGLAKLASVCPVSRETSVQLEQYVGLLRQWQKRINLVSPGTMDDVWSRHVADSAQSFALFPKAKHWIDLGSGAGFPGLVIALLMDKGGRVDLIESNGKKCAFLNAVIRETGIRDSGVEVQVHQGRIETVLPTLDQPEIISARALASLDDLLRLTNPYLQSGCIGLFSKGQDHKAEISVAEKNWSFDTQLHKSQFGDNSVLIELSNVHPN